MSFKIVLDGDNKLSASLVGRVPKNKHDELKAQYCPSILTDAIKDEMLSDINTILLPNDTMSEGFELREATRHGALKVLTKYLNLLP